jgi:hypothetical protein
VTTISQAGGVGPGLLAGSGPVLVSPVRPMLRVWLHTAAVPLAAGVGIVLALRTETAATRVLLASAFPTGAVEDRRKPPVP